MAHELTMRANGKAEMAFVGNRNEIWHGLGQELTEGSSIETWQREAGMDWEINSSALMYQDQNDDPQIFEGKQVLFRSDTLAPLSVVGDRYKVVQPKEVLEFFRSLTEDAGFVLSTAGTLFDGKKFWALADTKQKIGLNGGSDIMGGYLLLSSSCDGTLATSAQFTSVRVVCNNTLSIALSGSKQRISTRHTTEFKPNNVKQQLGLMEDSWDTFARDMEAMTKVKVSLKDSYRSILELVSPIPDDPNNADVRTANEIHNLYLGAGMGSDMAGKTAFGLLNAMTEYYDHHVGRIASNQLNSSFWGTGAKKKLEAYDYIMDKFGIAA
jgi:phage/plasmid-like protein (TIGR03299 family)